MKVQGLERLVERLIEIGFLLETRGVRTRKLAREEVVEIGDTGPLSDFNPSIEGSINYYLELLRQGKFSWMIFDGSLVQILYRRRGDQVTFHRYGYFPAPFNIDLRRQEAFLHVSDIIEGNSVQNPLDQTRKTILRFEFDPNARSLNHPASHLHLNTSACRLPIRAPITVLQFIHFMFRFQYSEQFEIEALPRPGFNATSTLSEDEATVFHLNWQPA